MIPFKSLDSLKPGDQIIIRVGSKGTQHAVVSKVAIDGKSARVVKWLARSKRWTNTITVYPVQVIGRA
jgi:sortase (surface protein transpeptidase)